jgi:hypothetical protein
MTRIPAFHDQPNRISQSLGSMAYADANAKGPDCSALNSDPRFSAQFAAIDQYERTRKIFESLVRPQHANLDKNLMGVY